MPASTTSPTLTTELRAHLEASGRALLGAIVGLDEEGFRARTRSSQWSPAEVLAHLLASERLYVGWAQAALEEDNLVLPPVAQDEQEQQAKLAQQMAVPQILHGLLAQRRDTMQLLMALSSEQLTRTLSYPGRGSFGLGLLFEKAAAHEEEHAAQIRSLRGAGAP